MFYNPAKMKVLHNEVFNTFRPASFSGSSDTDPKGNVRQIDYQQQLTPLQVSYVSGSATGLDTNGYYKCYVTSPTLLPTNTHHNVEVRLDASGSILTDGQFVTAYPAGLTTGMSDNGFWLFKPISSGTVGLTLLKTKVDTGSYPVSTDNCNMFPAVVYSGGTFSDSSCTNTISGGTEGTKVIFYNLSGLNQYIPEGSIVFGAAQAGTTSSGKPHYVGFWSGSSASLFIEGALASTLADTDANFTTSTITAFSSDGSDPTAGGMTTITINNPSDPSNYRYHGASGATYTAVKFDNTHYLLIDMTCS